MERRWSFVELADLQGVPELDPDRDALVLLHPTYDDPLLRDDADEETAHERAVARWETWLAS
jgi:hypothetical protein